MTGRRRKPGGMGPFIEGYRAWLSGRGYTPGTIVGMLAMAGGLGRWMDARGISPGDLDLAAITEFRNALRAAGMRCVPGAHGLDPLLEYLEGQGVLNGRSDLPRAFRTADLWLIHAANCCSTYSSWTCCGVRYWSPECRRLELYQNSMYLTMSRRACSRVGYWVR
jgi:hypothetical protein